MNNTKISSLVLYVMHPKSFGLGISEYLICTILMSLRHMKAHMHNQDQRKWNRFDDTIQSISGSCILILGLGDLGSTFAKKAKALGAYTIGVRKSKKIVISLMKFIRLIH